VPGGSSRSIHASSDDAKSQRRQAGAHRHHDVGLNSIVKNNVPASPRERWILWILDNCVRIVFTCTRRIAEQLLSVDRGFLAERFFGPLKDRKTRVVQINLEFGMGLNITVGTPTGKLQTIDLHRH